MKRLKNMVISWWCVSTLILFAWGFLSWVEIVSKNLTPNPVYSDWNLIIMLLKNYI